MRRIALVALIAGAAASVTALAAAGRSDSGGAAARPLPGLPAYTAGFERWLKLNKRPIRPRANDAHLGTKNVFVNRSKVRIPYPYGTVVVKSIKRPGERFVSVVAVMRKVRGANRRHHDWVMVEYERSTPRGRFSAFASGAVCTSCHMQAKRRDYVFTPLSR